MNKTQIKEFTSWLGKRSYKVRLKRLGLKRIQEIARQNGRNKKAVTDGTFPLVNR